MNKGKFATEIRALLQEAGHVAAHNFAWGFRSGYRVEVVENAAWGNPLVVYFDTRQYHPADEHCRAVVADFASIIAGKVSFLQCPYRQGPINPYCLVITG